AYVSCVFDIPMRRGDALAPAKQGGAVGRGWGGGEWSTLSLDEEPPTPARLARRPSPPLRGGRVTRGAAEKKITAPTSGNSRSTPARASGSFPGETASRHTCRAPPLR